MGDRKQNEKIEMEATKLKEKREKEEKEMQHTAELEREKQHMAELDRKKQQMADLEREKQHMVELKEQEEYRNEQELIEARDIEKENHNGGKARKRKKAAGENGNGS